MKGIVLDVLSILAINIFILYLYRALQNYYDHKEEKENLRIALESCRNQIEIMQESWDKARSLRHDLNLHIYELRYLTIHHDTDKVMAYLDEMEKQLVNEDEYVSSGIPEIDSILNYMLRYAKRTLKEVDIKVTLPEELEIHDFTLNVILGNLLNNAIRAASQSKQKYLSIYLQEKQGILYINIKNSYAGTLHKDGKRLISTKRNHEMHGIGLKNVEKIIQNQAGEIETTWNDELFCIKIMLFEDNLNFCKTL